MSARRGAGGARLLLAQLAPPGREQPEDTAGSEPPVMEKGELAPGSRGRVFRLMGRLPAGDSWEELE